MEEELSPTRGEVTEEELSPTRGEGKFEARRMLGLFH